MGNDGSKFMFFLILYYFGAALFLLPLFFRTAGVDEYNLHELILSPWFMIAQQLLVLLLPLVLWIFMKRRSFSDFLEHKPMDITTVTIIIVFSFLIQPAMMFISGFTGLFFPNIIADFVTDMGQHPFWLLLLAIAITPAIVEEVIFRGYIQRAYSGFDIKKAAIVNGIFFGIIHMNMQQFFYAFFMGVIFAYIVYYTKSILAAIISHFLVNASQVALLRAALFIEGLQEELYEIVDAAYVSNVLAVVAIGIFALFTTPIALFLLRALKKKHESENTLPEVEKTEVLAVPGSIVDRYMVAVIAMFVAFIVLSSLLL